MVDQLNIPYFKASIPDNTIKSIKEVLDSGWLTSGPKVKEFEEGFAQYIGRDQKALAVNSATSGLHLALVGTGFKQSTLTH